MNNEIKITYHAKTRRLEMVAPFFLADVLRGFPSRRFDPKSKKWKMPLVAGNVRHLRETAHLYDYKISPDAEEAIANHEQLSAAPKHIPFPSHVYKFTEASVPHLPMPHQGRMLDLSWGLQPSAWFAKMGVGKTFAAIHLAMARWIASEIDGVMIICPSALRLTWQKELAKFATRPYDFRIHDTKAPWLKEFYAARPKDKLPILAVSVEGLGVSEALYDSACGFMFKRRVMTICDESHRIKNPQALRTKRTIELGAVSTYRMILNGTPIALGIQDLWAQYEFLDPNIIGCGDYWAYKTRYIEMGGYAGKEIVGYRHVDELMRLIIPYTIEVGKDVLNLPPKMMKPIYCESTKRQKTLFRQIVKGVVPPGAPLIRVQNVLERSLRLRQVVGGYLPEAHAELKEIDGLMTETWTTKLVPLEDNPKLDLLEEIVSDNWAGTKFIIWATFRHEIQAIERSMTAKYGQGTFKAFYGSTPQEERSQIEDAYCNDPSLRGIVANPATAGLGLTFISGENDLMIYYSGTNAYLDRAQSEDRAHRIGQKNSVTVIDLVMEKTIDVLIQESIQAKMDVEDYILTKIKQGIKIDDLILGD